MISEDYGGAGTSTIPQVETCNADDHECMYHLEKDLIDYITNMILEDWEKDGSV